MKCAVLIVCILGYSIGLPSRPLPWEDVKGKNVYIDSITNNTVGQGIDGRIIGGNEITPHSRQYQVALFINGRSFCGGSMVSVNYVLTAAHCVTGEVSYVDLVFGAHNIQISETTQVIVTSSTIIVHPDYEASTFANDIALIKTSVSVVTNSNIRIITLAPADAETYENHAAFLTGWGKLNDDALSSISPVLMGVDLHVISNAVCARTYGNNIQQSVLCTSGDGYVGGCHGDSGSPLVADGVLIGFISFVSSRGCQAGFPTGFTRISSYRKWIADNSDVPQY